MNNDEILTELQGFQKQVTSFLSKLRSPKKIQHAIDQKLDASKKNDSYIPFANNEVLFDPQNKNDFDSSEINKKTLDKSSFTNPPAQTKPSETYTDQYFKKMRNSLQQATDRRGSNIEEIISISENGTVQKNRISKNLNENKNGHFEEKTKQNSFNFGLVEEKKSINQKGHVINPTNEPNSQKNTKDSIKKNSYSYQEEKLTNHQSFATEKDKKWQNNEKKDNLKNSKDKNSISPEKMTLSKDEISFGEKTDLDKKKKSKKSTNLDKKNEHLILEYDESKNQARNLSTSNDKNQIFEEATRRKTEAILLESNLPSNEKKRDSISKNQIALNLIDKNERQSNLTLIENFLEDKEKSGSGRKSDFGKTSQNVETFGSNKNENDQNPTDRRNSNLSSQMNDHSKSIVMINIGNKISGIYLNDNSNELFLSTRKSLVQYSIINSSIPKVIGQMVIKDFDVG